MAAHPQSRWGAEERVERDADGAPIADFSGKLGSLEAEPEIGILVQLIY